MSSRLTHLLLVQHRKGLRDACTRKLRAPGAGSRFAVDSARDSAPLRLVESFPVWAREIGPFFFCLPKTYT